MECVHREFSCKSPGERILKISPHLQKKTWYLKMYGFYWATMYNSSIQKEKLQSILLDVSLPRYTDEADEMRAS